MKKLIRILAAPLVFLLLGSAGVFADEIKVASGAAPTENILKPVKKYFEESAGIKLNIVSPGAKLALLELEKGDVDAAAAGLSFEDLMNLIKKEGGEIKNPSVLQYATIGKDKIAVITHKDNPVTRLTKEQLKGIFTGKITNWKDVGGKDMPVIVIWGRLIPGTNNLFVKNMLDGEPLIKDVLETTTAEDVRQHVASNPEATGIGPAAIVNDTVKSPDIPDISRPIILVTKGKPSPSVQKLIDFIHGEGQKYIKK